MNLQQIMMEYLECCDYQKKLSKKTIKAYTIDLSQFSCHLEKNGMELSRANILRFITNLHKRYKPKSVKRKIASVKALFSYLEYEELIDVNPFSRLKVKFREPVILPRTITLRNLQHFFSALYHDVQDGEQSLFSYKTNVRDIAVIELLFAAGLRVSELCSLPCESVDLVQGNIRVNGKGSRERVVHITNPNVLSALKKYVELFGIAADTESFFFVNRLGCRLSEQSVRFMIRKYTHLAGIAEHITPHMFRHTFATLLLEEDVDIRYIQQILGHSSIVTTQIYTHVTSNKQRDILSKKHPRSKIMVRDNGV